MVQRRSGSPPEGGRLSPSELDRSRHENETLIRLAFAEGQAAYPHVPLTYDVFAHRLVELVHRRPLGAMGDTSPGNFAERLTRAGGPDIFLAIACEEKVPGAWEAFTRKYAPGLKAEARRRRRGCADAEDLAEGLLGELYTPPARGVSGTRIGSYDGTGPLGAWLLAVLRNRLVDEDRRKTGQHRLLRKARPPASGVRPDPSDEVAGAESAIRFVAALRRGWSRLTPCEGLALLCKYRDGKSQVQIARLLQVGEPRVSRILAAGVGKIRREVRIAFPGEAATDLEDMIEVFREATGGRLPGDEDRTLEAAAAAE